MIARSKQKWSSRWFDYRARTLDNPSLCRGWSFVVAEQARQKGEKLGHHFGRWSPSQGGTIFYAYCINRNCRGWVKYEGKNIGYSREKCSAPV